METNVKKFMSCLRTESRRYIISNALFKVFMESDTVVNDFINACQVRIAAFVEFDICHIVLHELNYPLPCPNTHQDLLIVCVW